jgi:hypothetical protein
MMRFGTPPWILGLLILSACTTAPGRGPATERIRVDVVPSTSSGLAAQSIFSARIEAGTQTGDLNIRLADAVAVTGSVTAGYPPDNGPDGFGNTDPLRGLPAMIFARQVRGIGAGVVEILPAPPPGDEPPSGEFTMSLVPGTYDIEIDPTEHAALVIRQVFENRVAGNVGDTFSFVMQRGHPVAGQVLAPGAAAGMADVIVEAWAVDFAEATFAGPVVSTDADGFFDMALPSGEYELRMRPDPSAAPPQVLPSMSASLLIPDDLGGGLSWELPDFNLGTVLGTVLDAGGSPQAGVRIRLEGEPDEPLAPAADIDISDFVARTETAQDGTFLLEAPFGAAYRLYVIPPPGYSVGARVLTGADALDLSAATLNLGDLVLLDKPSVQGHVRDPQGRLLQGALVTVINQDNSLHNITAITDDAGWYRVGIDAGRALVQVTPVAGTGVLPSQPTSVMVGTGGVVLDVDLSAGRTVQGTVLDARSVGVPHALIELVHPTTDLPLGRGLTDGAGRYAVTIPLEALPTELDNGS